MRRLTYMWRDVHGYAFIRGHTQWCTANRRRNVLQTRSAHNDCMQWSWLSSWHTNDRFHVDVTSASVLLPNLCTFCCRCCCDNDAFAANEWLDLNWRFPGLSALQNNSGSCSHVLYTLEIIEFCRSLTECNYRYACTQLLVTGIRYLRSKKWNKS